MLIPREGRYPCSDAKGERDRRRLAMDKDPVCGMDVDPSTAKDTADYQRKTYYFCAPSCRQAFEADPARYLDSDHQPSM
jgi:P-type Cu+ transporter